MKILNLYAGIGGNRRLWGNKFKITAIEYNKEIAAVYKDLYPEDEVIIEDAHEYLLKNYKKFDFIWASPPCQSHSSFRQNICVKFRNTPAVYPDMRLYQEIIFLQYNFKGKWVVENVNPYYAPLIPPSAIIHRHFFWSNFSIPKKEFKTVLLRKVQIPQLQKLHSVDLSKYKIKNKRQILRNCVLSEVGEYILNSAFYKSISEMEEIEQLDLFNYGKEREFK